MIRIRKKATAPIPKKLQTDGTAAIAALIQRHQAGERNFSGKDFDSAIYGHEEVKQALIHIQDYKCCFCESKIGHVSYGDVEHFRPKAGWVQDTEAQNRPGYYWLAYDWDNLLLSCQLCNQRYKKNLFPLLAGCPRAICHQDDISKELALFIHPANEEVETLISFEEEMPRAINGNLRAVATIEKLGLDRELLNEQRRKILTEVRIIYELARDIPATIPALKAKAREYILQRQAESALDSTEYASMLRAFFRDNPVDF